MVLSLLSKNERAYLTGSKEFTAKQRRDIRYRLNKKLKLCKGDYGDWANGPREELNSRTLPDSSMATHRNRRHASLDMAGVGSPNLPRPISLFSISLSTVLGGILTRLFPHASRRRGCSVESASAIAIFFLILYLRYLCFFLLNWVPSKSACSEGDSEKVDILEGSDRR